VKQLTGGIFSENRQMSDLAGGECALASSATQVIAVTWQAPWKTPRIAKVGIRSANAQRAGGRTTASGAAGTAVQ